MKTKLFTLLFAFVASIGTVFASVTINGIAYNLDDANSTAEVTSRGQGFSYSGSIVIPSSVTYYSKTYSVTSIGGSAFYYCTGLTSITIPNSVTSIGQSAFYVCTGLTSVNISDIAAWCNINFADNPLYYAKHLYLNGIEITDLVIPNSVTSIGKRAFFGCSSLTSITIPNSVTNIGNGAFSGCTGLTSVTIPNSVTSIGSSVFSGCTGLTSITIPNSVTSIGSEAFLGCTGLTSITIPNSVTSIGSEAFLDCTNLTSVVAPTCIFEVAENKWLNCTHSLQSVTFTGGELTYNVLGILARSYKTLTYLDISGISNAELDDEAFKGFYNLQSLIFQSNLTKIGYMSVADCKSLQSVVIPASVQEIDNSAFENCRSLKTVSFAGQSAGVAERLYAPAAVNQLQRIGNWAFYNCHELQTLDIPEGVSQIGDGAFYGCTYLQNLSLPASVSAIGDNTFALCAKLKQIVVNAVVPPAIQPKTFFDVKREIPVYVPDECIKAYKDDALWREFNIKGISEMLTAIDETSINANMPGKLLRSGQVLIQRSGKTYTLQGQEVR